MQRCRLPALLQAFTHCNQTISECQDQAIALMVLLPQAIEKAPLFGFTVVAVLTLVVMFQM